MAANGLALGAVADFGAKSCQVTAKADAMHNVELTTKTAIEPNACYALVASIQHYLSIEALKHFYYFCGMV